MQVRTLLSNMSLGALSVIKQRNPINTGTVIFLHGSGILIFFKNVCPILKLQIMAYLLSY